MQRILDIQNRSGSVEHYYHFILGFLAPLLLRLDDEPDRIPSLIRSCGPFDNHLAALALPAVEIVTARALRAYATAWPGQIERLFGFDEAPYYDDAQFQRLRGLLLRRFDQTAASPRRGVLLVGRGNSPEFYQSEQAEIRGSANLRRSLPNLPAIGEALSREGWPIRTVALEATSLRDQVAMFAAAEAVVAQHGAALTNMLWMAPGAAILEINPMPPGSRHVDTFRALARTCGHRYDAVTQRSPHAPVDPGVLASRLKALLTK